MRINTFACRFTKAGDPSAPTVVYLLRADFKTPHDAFFEQDVPHWLDDEARKKTWGAIAGPLDLCLSEQEYAYYAQLAEECKHDFMSVVIARRTEKLCEG